MVELKWRRLEILDVTAGTPHDDTGAVEFVAHCRDAAGRRRGQQHANSAFVREDGRWFSVGLACWARLPARL